MRLAMETARELCLVNESTAHTAALSSKSAGFFIPGDGGITQVAQFQSQAANRTRYASYRGWLYSCVHAIASEGAGQPIKIGRMKGVPSKDKPGKRKNAEQAFIRKKMPQRVRTKAAKQELEILEDHPLVEQLERPNKVQGQWQFTYSFIANLCLTGWAFVVFDGDEVYSLPTTWITPKHEGDAFTGIEVRNPEEPTSKPEVYEEGQFGFAYLPNPSNPFGAIAPAQSQVTALRVDEHIQTSQEAFFRNGIFPSVIVTVGKDPHPEVSGGIRPRLTATQRRQVYAAIAKQMGGITNYGAPAIVDGLIESIEKLSMTQNEMGWEKSEQTIKTRILSAYCVHPYILGEQLNVGGYAQVANILERFYKRVNTYLAMLSEVMTQIFGKSGKDKNKILVWWEELEAKDPSVYWGNINKARDRGDLQQNEYRALLGMPPDEDGNEAEIDPKQISAVVQIMQLVGGSAITPEQAVAAFIGLGLSEELAEDLAGDGPQGALGDAVQALNHASALGTSAGHAEGAPPEPKDNGEEKAILDAVEKLCLSFPRSVKKDGPHEYSCLMANLPDAIRKTMLSIGESIDPEHLGEEGLEDDPHVTVKYGLHTEDVGDIQEVLQGEGPFEIGFGDLSLFENEDADVLKIGIKGRGIYALNKKVCDSLEFTDKHPVYEPHATIAYLKPGSGKTVLDQIENPLQDTKVKVTDLTFSSKNGTKTPLVLGLSADKAFCATGEGGGIDNSCSSAKPSKAEAKQQIMKDTEGIPHEKLMEGIKNVEGSPDKLFKINAPGAKTVPISRLQNIRAREEGIANASRLMYAAATSHPAASPRDPISVQLQPDGKYRVYDGNSTYAVLKEAGWKNAVVREVDAKGVPLAEGGKVDIRTSAMFTRKEQFLPVSTHQPVRSKEELYAKAEAVHPQYDASLDHGQGVDKALGATTIRPGGNISYKDALHQPGPLVLIAPLKKEGRAQEKVNGKYRGDWSRLKDVMRATVAVESKNDIPAAIATVREELGKKGWSLAEAPNNRMEVPIAGGYRDINTIWKHNETGMMAELQFNTKPMLIAKSTEGHKLYEEYRAKAEPIKYHGRKPTEQELDELDALEAAMTDVYNKAWKK